MLDNYEDLMKACADTARSAILAQIDEKLGAWAAAGEGLLLKTERDRYLFLFEECHYPHFAEEKFSILDSIREIRLGEGSIPPSPSAWARMPTAFRSSIKTPSSPWRWP